MTRVARERIYAVSKGLLHAPAVISPRYLRLQTCKRRQHKKRVLNCLQSIGGERSSAGRASVCGTEGRGFKPRRSPQLFNHLQVLPLARNPFSIHSVSTPLGLLRFSVHERPLLTDVIRGQMRVPPERYHWIA